MSLANLMRNRRKESGTHAIRAIYATFDDQTIAEIAKIARIAEVDDGRVLQAEAEIARIARIAWVGDAQAPANDNVQNHADPLIPQPIINNDVLQIDPEAVLRQLRSNKFNEMGMAVLDAEDFARALLNRDLESDDRRTCIECQGFIRFRCTRGRCVIGEGNYKTLHRCQSFIEHQFDSYSISTTEDAL